MEILTPAVRIINSNEVRINFENCFHSLLRHEMRNNTMPSDLAPCDTFSIRKCGLQSKWLNACKLAVAIHPWVLP